MEAAKAEVEQAIRLDPGLLPAWRLLAWLRSRAGERDLAIETWGSWLEAVSDDPRVSDTARSEAICDLGILLVRAKRHEEAMALLDAALEDLAPSDQSSRSSSVLAAAASEAGALEEALAALRVARESDPLQLLFIVQEALLLERLEPHSEAAHAAWAEVIEQTQGATDIGALLQRTRAEAHLAGMGLTEDAVSN
jgi:tetratricopeptide (TPR) repeat protein